MVRDESSQGGRSWAIESDDIRNETETLRTTINALSVECSTARVCLSSGPVRGRPRYPVAAASVAGGRATVAVIGQA